MKLRNCLAAGLLAFFPLVVLLASDVAWGADGPAARSPRDAHEKLNREDLAAPLREKGEIRIIVGLQTAQEIAQGVDRTPDEVKEQAVSARQLRVLQRVAGHNVRNVKRFRWHHFIAMTVDAGALDALLADPEITSVAEDRPVYPVLNDTPGITRADKAWMEGFRGAGQTVAIIDTGVDKTHPFFTGKVVAEACFSDPVVGATTYCPNSQPQQIGTGAGVNCPDSSLGCWHGTHVAGIAAGKYGVLSAMTGGIAPDASVIPIQVFQRDCSTGTCGLAAYDSDLLRALEYVYSLRTTYNIASANMSLGGTLFSLNCDTESPAITSVIQSLRTAGIATVIAAGNNSNAGAISFPGCISSAISVGSTTKQNAISSFSNSASFLSLLAPGSSITSSMPGGAYGTSNGTSMATPHVTGAWAVLKSAKPSATVSELLSALQSGGLPITDPRNGITKSLIQLGYDATTLGALGLVLGHGNVPPAVSITSPTEGAVFVAPQSVTVIAAAADSDGGISKVEFFQGANKIASIAAAPYSFVWTGVQPGNYTLTAVATDVLGGTTTSAPVHFGVNVPAPGTSGQIAGTIRLGSAPLAGVNVFAAGGTCLPTDSLGQYTCWVPLGWTGAVTPSLTGYSFTPPSRSYSNLTASVTGQDYTAAVSTDVVWVEDALPAGATAAGAGESWNWISTNPAPFSGSLAHQSGLVSGLHQHYFSNATATLSVGTGQSLFAYVYLDPANPPREVMLQWNDGTWEHRAYWGANLIPWGTDGTVSRRYMGALPPAGQWVRLEVQAALVGLEGSTVNGMAFTLNDGRATWDQAGKGTAASTFSVSGTVTLSGAGLGSVSLSATGAGTSCSSTNGSGQYSCTVPQGWTGTVTPALAGYTFTPPSRSYSNVTANQAAQNYTAAAVAPTTFTVSGTVTLSGAGLGSVSMAATNGVSCSTTNASGQYSCTAPAGWTGTVTPSLSGYTFMPPSRSYSNVTANQTAQNYTATAVAPTTFTVSGTVTSSGTGLNSVSMGVTGAGANCSGTNGSGQYSCTVPTGWTGTVTPSLAGYVFTPASRSYGNVVANQTAQGYSAAASTDIVWVEDALPAGAIAGTGGGDAWTWVSANPTPFSGALAHQSNLAAGRHQHAFSNATNTLSVGVGDTLFAYVYLDPANPPREVMLQWNDGTWEHRAYWGANLIVWGVDGTVSRRYMGVLPPAGQWARLEVPAALVGLEGSTLNGMAYTVYDGRATWDRAGKKMAGATYQVSGTVSVSGAGLANVSMAATNGVSCSSTNASGQYSCTVPQGWTGTVTPSSSGYTFTPSSRSYSNVTANQIAQDYTATASGDIVWVEDALPAGATAGSGGGDAWTWVSANPTPFSGALTHQSTLASGSHQHFFSGATTTLSVGVGDTLFAYVYLDPANPPSAVMLQWNDGTWEHRAYWGANLFLWGTDGSVSRRRMGALPPAGQWVRLEVPAALVGLEGSTLNGMAFTLYGGRATWDHAGKMGAGSGSSPPTLGFQSVATGLSTPLGIEHAGDSRLFVVQQGGQIRIISGGQVLPTPFLDITSLAVSGGERGLLGLAFHPSYAANGFLYVNYTRQSDGATVIARYTRSAGDPNVADPSSAQILMTVAQPFTNHKGGQLRFGPDGYLYIVLGDGGSANDPGNRAQDLATLLGKLLRIDVNSGSPYAIPASNPFVNDGNPNTLSEIWAYGLRNPWRFSFDRSTGDLFIADVGQSAREEINFQAAGTGAGANYGWRVMEGTQCTGDGGGAPCFDPSFTAPILDYDHGQGCSVTGGYRYRGAAYPALSGYFVYGDYCSGRIWGATRNANGFWSTAQLSSGAGFNISTFGEDVAGELYVAAYNTGVVYRLTAQ